MIKPVLTMGNPLLFNKSEPIAAAEFGTVELDNLIIDLYDTMCATGGVGIAAPQIGVNKRIFIIEYKDDNPRYDEIGNRDLTVVINPVVEFIGSEQTPFNEGCLSLPHLRGEVWRHKAIEYKYYDQYGNLHEGFDDGFFARVMQHELDHLDGILYVMRMRDIKTLSYTS
jgi:peptide deformylase